MSDRVTYRRLVNLGEYEHLLLEISREVHVADGGTVKDHIAEVHRWAELAKRRVRLERKLAYAKGELERLEAWAKEGEEAPPGLEDARARVEHVNEARTILGHRIDARLGPEFLSANEFAALLLGRYEALRKEGGR